MVSDVSPNSMLWMDGLYIRYRSSLFPSESIKILGKVWMTRVTLQGDGNVNSTGNEMVLQVSAHMYAEGMQCTS